MLTATTSLAASRSYQEIKVMFGRVLALTATHMVLMQRGDRVLVQGKIEFYLIDHSIICKRSFLNYTLPIPEEENASLMVTCMVIASSHPANKIKAEHVKRLVSYLEDNGQYDGLGGHLTTAVLEFERMEEERMQMQMLLEHDETAVQMLCDGV
jgi:hypothetical protein